MVIASSVSLIEAMIRISLPQDLDGIHRVIGDDAASVGGASTDVVAQNGLHRDPHRSDDRLAPEDVGLIVILRRRS
jgi:hypothetical protein